MLGWFAVAPVMRWRATHFVVTDRRILIREGVFSRTGIVVAGRSITVVRTVRARAERLLGSGTLVVGVDDAREADRIVQAALTRWPDRPSLLSARVVTG